MAELKERATMTEEKLIQERKHVIKLQSTIDDMKLKADAQDVEQPLGDENEVVGKLRTGAEVTKQLSNEE